MSVPPSRIQLSPQKLRLIQRVIAKLLDLAIVVLASLVMIYPIGPLAGFAYSLLSDGLRVNTMQGQSVGKWLFKFRVVRRLDGGPCGWKDSAIRNAPVGVATFFGIIPIWGWLVLLLVGLPLMCVEIYLMVRSEGGRRLGDLMAETDVVDIRPGQSSGISARGVS